MSGAHFHAPLNLSCWLFALAEDKCIQNINGDKKRAGKTLSNYGNFHRKKHLLACTQQKYIFALAYTVQFPVI